MRLMTPPSPTRFRTPFEKRADGATVPYEWGGISLSLERPGVGDAFALRRRQRLDGAGLVEPYVGVELAGERHAGIVALQLGIRPVDHADEALQPLLGQPALQRGVMVEHQYATL